MAKRQLRLVQSHNRTAIELITTVPLYDFDFIGRLCQIPYKLRQTLSTKVESFLLEEDISVHTKSDRTGTAVDAAPIVKVRSDMAECFCCGSDYKSTDFTEKSAYITCRFYPCTLKELNPR